MTNDSINAVLVSVGKAQVDAMFRRDEDYATDDSEFLPLVQVMINAFRTAGIDNEIVEEVWEYACSARKLSHPRPLLRTGS